MACQDANKLSDIIWGKHMKERSPDTPMDLKAGKRFIFVNSNFPAENKNHKFISRFIYILKNQKPIKAGN